jgi:hypothetical protein
MRESADSRGPCASWTRRSIDEVEQSTEFRIEQVLSRVSHLVDCGAITDPVVSAYLVSLQQRVDHDQPIDSVTVAQFEYLADVLEKVPDP